MTHDRQASARRGNLVLGGTAALGAVAGLLWLTRGAASAKGAITYPPVDTPKPFAADIWIVDSGPIRAMGMTLPIRMTVVRLTDGGLLLHSPTRYTPALGQALTALGPVRHLVAPTVAHWTFLKDWQQACPEATSWGVPALRARAAVRKAGVRIDADLSDQAPEAWASDIAQGLVRGGGGFEEAWFHHRASGTLILADLVENLEPAKLTPMTAAAMRATLATRATTGLHVRAALRIGGARVRAAVGTMIATAPERVIFAHGAPFTRDGADRLRRAFAWLI
ncbi:DUF4336 domain-containing protein [Sphingomonas fuzhouensis]|uniref:DUF4336 domain-containing protein n=1 Tax=Sphingomonas fuzhouensis TaxID=3106033 RepID=UPI002AFE18E1|nr:DUF4336 domain-containing protein [Sphingomonas sp. SGZ-02]